MGPEVGARLESKKVCVRWRFGFILVQNTVEVRVEKTHERCGEWVTPAGSRGGRAGRVRRAVERRPER